MKKITPTDITAADIVNSWNFTLDDLCIRCKTFMKYELKQHCKHCLKERKKK